MPTAEELPVPQVSPSRRTVITGLAAGGLALPVLAACGQVGANAATTPPPKGKLTPTSAIPVGGGKIFDSQQVVVTQPVAGEYKAFSAVCTHQGCLVASISGGDIVCPCHGSMFSIKDGAVLGGPAPAPLPAVKIAVKGGEISLA